MWSNYASFRVSFLVPFIAQLLCFESGDFINNNVEYVWKHFEEDCRKSELFNWNSILLIVGTFVINNAKHIQLEIGEKPIT